MKKKNKSSQKTQTLTFKARFKPGDEIFPIYYDYDIGAWNVQYERQCNFIKIVAGEDGVASIEYCDDQFCEVGYKDGDNLYTTSLEAANEAKRRNNEGLDENLQVKERN